MLRFHAAAVLILTAASWAQAAHPSAASSSRPSTRALPEAGAISNGVYHNSAFGFSYKLPFGWVDRTADMQDGSAEASKSRLLLAIFERPPEASGDTVNSAVVIAAEPVSVYPGMKTAADYFGPLTELATAKGFQAEEGPYEFSVGTAKLVRGDFSKPRGTLTMRQTFLARLEKGYAISFTFIAGNEDEVSELIEKLSFTVRKSVR